MGRADIASYRNSRKSFFETLIKEGSVGFEFLMAVATKIMVFWVVTPFSSEGVGRFIIRIKEAEMGEITEAGGKLNGFPHASAGFCLNWY
jgi:hypothetical protein